MASLLAGEEIPSPGSGGLTVFEVINKERKAMQEVLRSLRPQMERELETLGYVTKRIALPLS